jgi:hypothetical protein
MARRKSSRKTASASRRRRPRPRDEELQGPPPREATILRDDRERRFAESLGEQTSTSPRLSGGDVDADWRRADSVGEEAVGGSVATPDQNVVDELGEALGLSRGDDAEFRAAEEILRDRDRSRWDAEVEGRPRTDDEP